jgi:two-component system sensor histidine kinase CreC
MKLGTRIFISCMLIFAVCFYYPIHRIIRDLTTRYLESIEDPLVDQANILASIVGVEMEANDFNPEKLYDAFERAYSRSLSAKIYEFLKTEVDIRVYITDASGRVLFDSEDRQNLGTDYSAWRDVRLTLEGEYGARSTRSDPEDPTSSVLYVAAPILVYGKTAGVLTVVKPTTNINTLYKNAKPRIFRIGILGLAAAIFLSFIVSIWITRPIKRLTQYANDVREGHRAELPELGRSELREMGLAFEKMREALEGKKYVEEYVQTLNHEIKSPLSAIRGAAELLEEGMAPEKRARFLANIRNEANRIQDIVDRMLMLSELENQRTLQKAETMSLSTLIRRVLESKEPVISKKKLTIAVKGGDDISVRGDPFLLHQALSNLIQNAVDFSPVEGRIEVTAQVEKGTVEVIVEDRGPGIPDYAREKVFDKFFSLQRPDTGRKSTGLGLNLVREVAFLHKGEIRLVNLPEIGLRATLSLPVCPERVS